MPQRDYYFDLARKGRGGAISALRDGRWRPTKSQLRRLTLHWSGDRQIEELRGWYTVQLIKASQYENYLTELVIRHLSSARVVGANRSHRASIVLELARRGDERARTVLYECFDPAHDFRFSGEILDLDGLAGLKWLIERAGPLLNHFEAYFWLSQLKDALGEPAVAEWLASESAVDTRVAEFARLAAETIERVERPQDEPLTFEEFLAQPGSGFPIGPLAWMRRAPGSEVEKAWRKFQESNDPDWLRRMSSAMKRRPGQCDIGRLIERAKQWKGDPNPFATSLEELIDPRVRALAFDLIDGGSTIAGLGLLSKNAVPGDEAIILSALQTLSDEDEIHYASIDLFEMSEALDLVPHYLWMYEELYCSFCRVRVVEHLISVNQASKDILRECLLDCEADIRKAAEAKLNEP
jgi:hypothetical protein